MPRNSKNFMDKYRELEYMQDIDHSFSTGNRFMDKQIAKTTTKLVNKGINYLVKDPRIKLAVKAGSKVAEKSYPYIEDVGAWTARVYTAYEETHKKK